MSDRPPPPRAYRRSSTGRSVNDYGGQEGLTLRHSRSGAADNINPFAVATGVNRAPSRTSSMQPATRPLSISGRQPSDFDLASNRTESAYSQPGAPDDLDRFGANLSNSVREREDKSPGHTSTLKGNRDTFASKKTVDGMDASLMPLPSLRYNGDAAGVPPSRTDREPRRDHGHNHEGFFGHVKHAFERVAHDPHDARPFGGRAPSHSLSRRNSWSDTRHASNGDSLDNFEQTQAINDEVEDTYFIDDGSRRLHLPHLRRGLSRHNSIVSEGTGPRHGFRSYRDRRKKEKHIIKYHAESTEDYQKFILLFAKALLAFGSPSHRIEAQLNSLAKVFELEAQFQHTPGIIQVSFGNPEQKSSETCLIKSGVNLSLGRIHSVHNVYRAVLHDDMYASDGTRQLRKLLLAPPQYGQKTRYMLSFITCLLICGVAFGGSLNDTWVAGVMGVLVRFMQNIASKSDLSASGSEVFTAAIVSFIARGFASYHTRIWCFSAISSAGVISLLPGYLILSGSLDIAGKNQSLGAPKIVSGIMTSLYLGFGLTLGSDLFLFLDRPARRAARAAAVQVSNTMLTGYYQAYNATESGFDGTGNATLTGYFTFSGNNVARAPDQDCYRAPNWGWYLQPMPYWTLFFLVPLFALCSSMNNQQHWWSRQMVVMVTIACISFWFTRLCNMTLGLRNHPDYVSLIGSWLVGILGNGYSRRFGGTAFTAMLTGILLLVPDGLSAAGGLAQQNQVTGQDEYTQSLTLARKMISVIIGILAGVYSSAAIIYVFGKKKNAALVTF